MIIVALSGLIVALGAGSGKAQNNEQERLNRAVIKIDTLTCGACFSTINGGLKQLDGYSGMGANLLRKLIAVDFTAPLTKEAISAKLSEVGYPGEVTAVDSITQKESFAYMESRQSRSRGNGGGCCSTARPAQPPVSGQGGSCCAVPGVKTSLPGNTL